jgi:death on curing protein
MTTAKSAQRLDLRGLVAIHGELLARYGGHSRKVDMAKLETALLRAVKLAGDGKRDMHARLAAGYAWALLKNRPFAEGNERTALAAMVTYLEMNRHTWNCGEVEETAMLLRASAGKLKEAEWEAWVVGNVGK